MKKSTIVMLLTAIVSLVIGIAFLSVAAVQAATEGYDQASKYLADLPAWSDTFGDWDLTFNS
jgi:flagellar basal body-associated protein FliL